MVERANQPNVLKSFWASLNEEPTAETTTHPHAALSDHDIYVPRSAARKVYIISGQAWVPVSKEN